MELSRNGTLTNMWSEGYHKYDLEYADDTLPISLTTPQMQRFLTAVEEGSPLQRSKAELLQHPGHSAGNIKFEDGAKVTKVSYLCMGLIR